jgi:putative ATPase
MISLFGDDTPQGTGEIPFQSQQGDDDHRPLAARMRPRRLEEYAGQEELIGPGRPLRMAIEHDRLPSMILWGPPGSGKTTLAALIAKATKAHFTALSAVSAGVADLRRVVADAAKLKRTGRATVLFIDEIHRFNRGQQDAVLPYVEDGTVIMIGATTENPSFEVNGALLSRSRVFLLQALSDESISLIVTRALEDSERRITTSSAPSSRAFAGAILMRRSIGSRGWSKAVRIRSSSCDAW